MTQEAQDMMDTRALELATAANDRAAALTSKLDKLTAWTHDHELHDSERFAEGQRTVTESINGLAKSIYGMLWKFAFGIGGALLAVILVLVQMLK